MVFRGFRGFRAYLWVGSGAKLGREQTFVRAINRSYNKGHSDTQMLDT